MKQFIHTEKPLRSHPPPPHGPSCARIRRPRAAACQVPGVAFLLRRRAEQQSNWCALHADTPHAAFGGVVRRQRQGSRRQQNIHERLLESPVGPARKRQQLRAEPYTQESNGKGNSARATPAFLSS